MSISHPIQLLNAGRRAVLVLLILVGAADLAMRLAFTPSMIQFRVDRAIRTASSPAFLITP